MADAAEVLDIKSNEKYIPTEFEKFNWILDSIPDFPSKGRLPEQEVWVWEFVRKAKEDVITYEECRQTVWDPYTVKKCFITQLKQGGCTTAQRRMLVSKYNKYFGSGKYPKGWSVNTIMWLVTNNGDLPPIDRTAFKYREGNAQCYSKLLAAIYLSSLYADPFIFAATRFGKEFDCNSKTVWKILSRLCEKGILSITSLGHYVRPTADGQHQGGKSTWYHLENPDGLLNLFQFKTDMERESFVGNFKKIKNNFTTHDWGEYIIRTDWLKENSLQ